jgi:hypothetical protein
MRNPDLDILFTPVYLQAHFLLKALFAIVYVWSGAAAEGDWFKLPTLTLINLICLLLNYSVEPCPVRVINAMRTASLAGATWAGVSACGFLASDWLEQDDVATGEEDTARDTLLLLWLFYGWITVGLGSLLYHWKLARHQTTEYELARAFLELEFQMKHTNERKSIESGSNTRKPSKGKGKRKAKGRSGSGGVHPRVLEPLVSLTLLRSHTGSGKSGGNAGSANDPTKIIRPKPVFLLLQELQLGGFSSGAQQLHEEPFAIRHNPHTWTVDFWAKCAEYVEVLDGSDLWGLTRGAVGREAQHSSGRVRQRVKHVAFSVVEYVEDSDVNADDDTSSGGDGVRGCSGVINSYRRRGWMVYVMVGDHDCDDSCTWGVWAGSGVGEGLTVESDTAVRVEKDTRVAASFDGLRLRLYLNGDEVGCSGVTKRPHSLFERNRSAAMRIGAGHNPPGHTSAPLKARAADTMQERAPFVGTIRNPQIFAGAYPPCVIAYSAQVELAERYIPLCIDVLSYDNLRVQFQSCWALANLASIGERQCDSIRIARGIAPLLLTSRASSDIGLKVKGARLLVSTPSLIVPLITASATPSLLVPLHHC